MHYCISGRGFNLPIQTLARPETELVGICHQSCRRQIDDSKGSNRRRHDTSPTLSSLPSSLSPSSVIIGLISQFLRLSKYKSASRLSLRERFEMSIIDTGQPQCNLLCRHDSHDRPLRLRSVRGWQHWDIPPGRHVYIPHSHHTLLITSPLPPSLSLPPSPQ